MCVRVCVRVCVCVCGIREGGYDASVEDVDVFVNNICLFVFFSFPEKQKQNPHKTNKKNKTKTPHHNVLFYYFKLILLLAIFTLKD